MKKVMKILVLIPMLYTCYNSCGQCTPASTTYSHNLSGTFTTVSLFAGDREYIGFEEEDLCGVDTWITVFEDNFDGMEINKNFWGKPPMFEKNFLADYDTYPVRYVSDGTLKLGMYTIDQGLHTYLEGGLQSNRYFPSGRFEVKARMNYLPENQNLDIAPLWTNSQLEYEAAATSDPGHQESYWNEIDNEFREGNTDRGQYTLHVRPPRGNWNSSANKYDYVSDGNHLQCLNNSHTYKDNNWHTFIIDWDMYHIYWYVDNELVNILTRSWSPLYAPFPIPIAELPYSECDGAPYSGIFVRDYMFPLFTNHRILMGLGTEPNGSTYFIPSTDPIMLEVDYVRVSRKINCEKNLQLQGFRSSGGIGCLGDGGDQVPPIYNNQTPSVITGGNIIAGNTDGTLPYIFRRDDFDYTSRQDLDLIATESVTLLPGFETDLLYQANGPCSPRYNSGQILGNNWTIGDGFSASVVDCGMSKTDWNLPKPPKPSEIDTLELLKHLDETKALFAKIQEKGYLTLQDVGYRLNVSPNPASSKVDIGYFLPEDGNVKISLYDLNEKYIETLVSGAKMSGTNESYVHIDDLAPGVYFVVMEVGDIQLRQKLAVVR